MLGRFQDHILPIQGPRTRLGYRDRGVLHWGLRDARWIYGLIRDEEILPIPNCPVHSHELNQAYREVSESLPTDFPLRFTVKSGLLLTFVFKSKPDSALEKRFLAWLIPWLNETRSGVRGVYASWNPSTGHRVLAPKTVKHIAGVRAGSVQVFGKAYAHGPGQFLQTRPEMMEKALERSAHYFKAATSSPDSILDLYSGIGIGMDLWTRESFQTLGIELSGEAVEYGRAQGLAFLQGKVSERIPQIREWLGDRKLSGIFLNPPRMGLEEEWVVEMDRIRSKGVRSAYLSCNPVSLSRDLDRLADQGWRVDEIQPYDFFPQTKHTEVLALFKRD